MTQDPRKPPAPPKQNETVADILSAATEGNELVASAPPDGQTQEPPDEAPLGNGWLDDLGPKARARCVRALLTLSEFAEDIELDEGMIDEADGLVRLCEVADETGWDKSLWAMEQRQWMLDLVASDPEDEELHIEAVRLLHWLPELNQVSYEKHIKGATQNKLTLTDIKRIGKALHKEQQERQLGEIATVPDTHDGIARDVIAKAERPLISCNSAIFQAGEDCVWSDVYRNLEHSTAEKYQHLKKCSTAGDYKGIMRMVRSRTLDDLFLRDTPYGLAFKSTYYTVENGKLVNRPLTIDDHQTFRLEFDPVRGSYPSKLLTALMEGMDGSHEDKLDQLKTIQQVIGTQVMGLMSKHRCALLLKGPTSCGKSVLLNTVAALFPPEAVSRIAPQDLDDKELIQPLGKARVNIVTELQNTQGSIVGDKFKMLAELQPLPARTLYIGSYTLFPSAAQLFGSNVWPKVDSPDSGFWERFAVIVFAHTKPKDERNLDLQEEIIREELPLFAGWLLDGVEEYLKAGTGLHFSRAHHAGIADWKRRRDSVAAFLMDCDSITERHPRSSVPPIMKTGLFQKYLEWFGTSGYKHAVGKDEFYERVGQQGGQPNERWGPSKIAVFMGYAAAPRNGNLSLVE